MGIVSPLGVDCTSTWDGFCKGQSAVRHVDLPLDEKTGRAMRAVGAPCPLATIPHDGGRLANLADQAIGEAMGAAGWANSIRPHVLPDAVAEEFGCSFGNSKGDLEALWRHHARWGVEPLAQDLDMRNTEPQNDSPSAREMAGLADFSVESDSTVGMGWLEAWPHALASRFAARWQSRGPLGCPVAACATGLFAVMQAADWISDGRCRVALAGSADAALIPAVVGSYQRLGILVPARDQQPERSVRPFAADRQGFAVGEGAAAFVLEDADFARQRGAPVLAEVAGWASASDARSITAMTYSPEALVYVIHRALEKAGLVPGDVGHVNCHGTATTLNDPWEAAGIRRALGEHGFFATANKGAIGHLLGAAGAVELALTVIALQTQTVPPTLHCDMPDPDCTLPLVIGSCRKLASSVALKISLGFGGHLGAVIVRLPTR